LNNDQVAEAYALVKTMEPSNTREYILKAVVLTLVGQNGLDPKPKEQIRAAQNLYKMIGSSVTERDTIPGRQSMSSCFFLARQFEDVLVY